MLSRRQYLSHIPMHCVTDILTFFWSFKICQSSLAFALFSTWDNVHFGFSLDVSCHFHREASLDQSNYGRLLYYFSRVVITKCHTLGSLNNIILFSHSPGVQKTKIKVQRVGFFCGLSPGLVGGCVFPHVFTWFFFPLCACVQTLSSYRDTSHIQPNHLVLTLTTSLNTLSPNTVTFQGTTDQDFNI